MRNRVSIVLLISGILLLILSVGTILLPFIASDVSGTIEVNWANPVGIKMDDLREGDSFDLTYRSDINVSLYFISREQANEYRSPSLNKKPLPQPIISGDEGEVDISVETDGDYELLFLAEEPARTFEVDYEMDRSLPRERAIFIMAGTGLLMTSLVFIVLGIVLSKKGKKQVICK